MNKFFNYYNSLCVGANTPTVFSFDPYVTAIKELLFAELQQIVYYIEKLKDLNVDMSLYTDKVIEFISILIFNLDFKKESFFVIMEDLHNNKKMLEKLYISACDKSGIKAEILESNIEDFSNKDSIIKALNEREQNIQISKIKLNKNTKNLYEIMINLVLNSCNCLIELKNLGINFSEAKAQVLKLLNSSNIPELTEEEWKDTINNFSKCNYKIMKTLYEKIIEKYGPVLKTEVPLCKRKGKAILVSGSSFPDLEKILQAVKGLNINVYTHHDMLNAFQYEKFKEYQNLTGHFQKSNNNFPLDFASFPGPIYISRNSIPKIDVIRGQIYTSAKYPSYGIGKIENNDFSPLITYALESKGFDKDEDINIINIGYSNDEIKNMTETIIQKYLNKEIKKIVIIGLIDNFNKSNDYINKFLKYAPDDTYIISFSYYRERNNFWHVNSYYDFAALYKIIEILLNKVENINKDTSVFLTDCNSGTISHIFNLLYLGIKNIFLGPCCPNIINPVLIDGLTNLFNIKPLTDVQSDINLITKKEEE